MSPHAMKVLTYVFPAITFIITAFMPAALQVSFFVSGFLSYLQALLFRWPAFRSYFNMYPLASEAPAVASKPTPYRGTMKVRAPLTQAELNRTYQGSRSASTASPAGSAEAAKAPDNAVKKFMTGTVQGTIKDLSSTVKEVTNSAKELLGRGKESLQERQAKSDRSAAAAYEERRQKEIRQERYERAEARRAERAARRNQT
jgi:YidC/Oxa1 family membrane protein insertase